MNRREWFGLLCKQEEGLLNEEEARLLSSALETSANLQEEQGRIRKLRALLREQPVALPSDGFAGQVEARISNRGQQWLWQAAAAAAVMFLVASLSIYCSSGSLSAEAWLGTAGLQPEDAVTLLELEISWNPFK